MRSRQRYSNIAVVVLLCLHFVALYPSNTTTGFAMPSLWNRSSSSNDYSLPTRKRKRKLTPEPAGAEGIFARATSMRRKIFSHSNTDKNDKLQQQFEQQSDNMSRSFDTTSSATSSLPPRRRRKRDRLIQLLPLHRKRQKRQCDNVKEQVLELNAIEVKSDNEIPPIQQLQPQRVSNSTNINVNVARKTIDLPDWAITEKSEEENLVTMKSLLKDDLEKLQSKTITVKDISNDDNYDNTDNKSLEKSNTKNVIQAFPDVYGDLRLLRFLRKQSPPDPSLAAERFRHFIQWRQKYNIDEKIRTNVVVNEGEPFVELNPQIAKLLPCDFNVPANQERQDMHMIPIVLNVGDWDTSRITQLITSNKEGSISMDEFLQHWTYLFESLHLRLYRESMQQRTMVFVDEIADLTNMRLTQFGPKFVNKVMKPWLKLTQDFYPETTKRIILLHPPGVLRVAWNIVANFVSPGTVAKIKLYNDFKGSVYDFVNQGGLAKKKDNDKNNKMDTQVNGQQETREKLLI